MKKIACKYGKTIETIQVSTTDNWKIAHVIVKRCLRTWNEDHQDYDYQYMEHEYKVSWYGAALQMLEQWSGAQVFGAPRGNIGIGCLAYVHGISAAATYIVHRMKRKETKRRWY